MAEIREYYLLQMHKVREHYEQQHNLIVEFSINNKTGDSEEAKSTETYKTVTTSTTNNGDILSKTENGNISLPNTISREEDLYKYNDTMKCEIQKITSLRNLHEIFLETEKIKSTTNGKRVIGHTADNQNFDFLPNLINTNDLRTAESPNNVGCGSIYKTSEAQEEDVNEETSMLNMHNG